MIVWDSKAAAWDLVEPVTLQQIAQMKVAIEKGICTILGLLPPEAIWRASDAEPDPCHIVDAPPED